MSNARPAPPHFSYSRFNCSRTTAFSPLRASPRSVGRELKENHWFHWTHRAISIDVPIRFRYVVVAVERITMDAVSTKQKSRDGTSPLPLPDGQCSLVGTRVTSGWTWNVTSFASEQSERIRRSFCAISSVVPSRARAPALSGSELLYKEPERKSRGRRATELSRRFGNIATDDKLALIPGR